MTYVCVAHRPWKISHTMHSAKQRTHILHSNILVVNPGLGTLAARNPRRPRCCPQARTRKTSERCLRPLVRARMHAYASPPSPHEVRPRACLSCAGPAAGPGRVRRALPQPNRLVLLVPSEGPLRALRRPDALSRRSEAQKAGAGGLAFIRVRDGGEKCCRCLVIAEHVVTL